MVGIIMWLFWGEDVGMEVHTHTHTPPLDVFNPRDCLQIWLPAVGVGWSGHTWSVGFSEWGSFCISSEGSNDTLEPDD